MPSEAEVKIWIEHANEYSRKFDGFNPPWLVGLKSLASSWLGRKWFPKRLHDDNIGAAGPCKCEVINRVVDECRLASVVSEEAIKKIVWSFNVRHDLELSGDELTELAHAIASYVNGRAK